MYMYVFKIYYTFSIFIVAVCTNFEKAKKPSNYRLMASSSFIHKLEHTHTHTHTHACLYSSDILIFMYKKAIKIPLEYLSGSVCYYRAATGSGRVSPTATCQSFCTYTIYIIFFRYFAHVQKKKNNTLPAHSLLHQ